MKNRRAYYLREIHGYPLHYTTLIAAILACALGKDLATMKSGTIPMSISRLCPVHLWHKTTFKASLGMTWPSTMVSTKAVHQAPAPSKAYHESRPAQLRFIQEVPNPAKLQQPIMVKRRSQTPHKSKPPRMTKILLRVLLTKCTNLISRSLNRGW
ncbi:hypothetical protein FH972_000787 [Carpinus fangiana]|uniref:Uncharacterized protein n=1 Tax=Carpinus fangiana TaxID=176857 RepID=A0A5N6Q9T8_9ROSI|nr:hypothetical protein FH972_000787 [Carpinus fangiana]